MIEPTAFAPGLAAVPRATHQQQASNKLNLPSDQKNPRIFRISKKAKHQQSNNESLLINDALSEMQ